MGRLRVSARLEEIWTKAARRRISRRSNQALKRCLGADVRDIEHDEESAPPQIGSCPSFTMELIEQENTEDGFEDTLAPEVLTEGDGISPRQVGQADRENAACLCTIPENYCELPYYVRLSYA